MDRWGKGWVWSGEARLAPVGSWHDEAGRALAPAWRGVVWQGSGEVGSSLASPGKPWFAKARLVRAWLGQVRSAMVLCGLVWPGRGIAGNQ